MQKSQVVQFVHSHQEQASTKLQSTDADARVYFYNHCDINEEIKLFNHLRLIKKDNSTFMFKESYPSVIVL